MKRIILAGAAALCFSNVATAGAIVNGSFETGDFSGWDNFSFNGGSHNVSTNVDGFGATEGTHFANLSADSYMEQTISWSAGAVLTFDWNFISQDALPYNDTSIFLLQDDAGNILDIALLADVASVGDFFGFGNAVASDWQTYSYHFESSGNGIIGFGVANDFDSFNDSQLLIDNVALPEPTHFSLFGLALAGLCLTRRQTRKRS